MKKDIYLYTDFSNRNVYKVRNNEAFFRRFLSTFVPDERELEVMKIIDGVTMVDGTYIKAKYGSTHLSNISTGLKTYLNMSYLQKKQFKAEISLIEAGPNVIDYIFRDVDEEYIRLIVTNSSFNYLDDSFKFYLNKQEVKSIRDFMSINGGV